MNQTLEITRRQAAKAVREAMPEKGLFAGHTWRVSPSPFRLSREIAAEIESLGRVLLQFYRCVNLLYRQSVEGEQPPWVARWLDRGKPRELVELQRADAFKHEVPRVIRPDLLLTEHGISVTELDSVPGGIGLTAWLNWIYSELAAQSADDRGRVSEAGNRQPEVRERRMEEDAGSGILGGVDGMIEGFAGIFGQAPRVHVVVSEEAATYRPEMQWLAGRMDDSRFEVRNANFTDFEDGDAVYRFFELFDLANVPSAKRIFELAAARRIRLTPPPKPIFEEKLLFALLWNRNLQGFWRRELGESFFKRLLGVTPYTWLMDPAPLPPHAAIPELNLTDWQQLKELSKKERELILKVSGFSEHAWGARGVYLGSDLPHADWAEAVDRALSNSSRSPFILQRYHKPALLEASWFDFERDQLVPMKGRARLCPFFFVIGEGDAARARLGGVLATICPPDKKIIHGMTEAIFAPCSV